MEHYAHSEQLKQASRRARRSDDRRFASEQFADLPDPPEAGGPE
jgi:hypothetical protein